MELARAARGRSAFSNGRRLYVRAPHPVCFPSQESLEEHVSETKRHLKARTTLFLLLEEALADASVGSDQFVYWDAGDPKRCLAPDVFVKVGSQDQSFDSWKIWERGAPDLAVEIVSDSDRSEADWDAKLERYQVSGISEVVRFDAEDPSEPIRVWDRVEGELVERAPESATLRECGALGLWWVTVPSELGLLLRLARDREGKDLLPTPNEERSKLREELAEERRARGVAEHERIVAEKERDAATAEVERLRAEIARLRGEGLR